MVLSMTTPTNLGQFVVVRLHWFGVEDFVIKPDHCPIN